MVALCKCWTGMCTPSANHKLPHDIFYVIYLISLTITTVLVVTADLRSKRLSYHIVVRVCGDQENNSKCLLSAVYLCFRTSNPVQRFNKLFIFCSILQVSARSIYATYCCPSIFYIYCLLILLSLSNKQR